MTDINISLENQLAGMASDMQAEQLQLQLAVALMKSIQDQQEAQARALIEMIQQAPSPDPAIGRFVDASA